MQGIFNFIRGALLILYFMLFQKLKPPESCEARTNLQTGKTEYIYDEDLDEDEDSVFDRLPDNVKELQEAITCSQGCMLLLVLREHLKDFYGFPSSSSSSSSGSILFINSLNYLE